MAESIKETRVETLEDRRPARRDPRAEPDSVLPDAVDKRDASGQRLDVTGIGPHSPSVRTPPDSTTRTAPGVRIERTTIPDEHASVSVRRPPDTGHSLDVAGAAGIATLRRQLAVLQLQLSDAQGQLAREQEGRATDAEELARVLVLLSSSETENDALIGDLERERAFVEELRVSVREKYEECNVLRQRLADAESLVAKQLEEAAERATLGERAEHEVSDLTERLAEARASGESARTEIAALSTQRDALQRAQETLEGELAETDAALKSAHMKVLAANKQLESWKSESHHTMEQTRLEQEAVLAKTTAEHAEATASLRRQADDAGTLVLTLQKQMEGATEELELAAKSLEALEDFERQVHGLREEAKSARRIAIDHTAQAKKELLPSAPGLAASPPVASPPFASPPFASPPLTSPPLLGSGPPASLAITSRAPSLAQTTRPPVAPLARLLPSFAPTGAESPTLEIGEMEMGADDLVLELIEARKRDGL
jgi:hypothetical protein